MTPLYAVLEAPTLCTSSVWRPVCVGGATSVTQHGACVWPRYHLHACTPRHGVRVKGWSACVQGPFHFLAAHTRQSRRRCDVRTPRAGWCSHVTRDPDQGMCLVRVIIEGGLACHSVNPLFLALLCTRWFFVNLHPGASLLQVGHPRHRGCAYAHLTHHQAGGSSCTAAREIW
jgi:hypothetical protein